MEIKGLFFFSLNWVVSCPKNAESRAFAISFPLHREQCVCASDILDIEKFEVPTYISQRKNGLNNCKFKITIIKAL